MDTEKLIEESSPELEAEMRRIRNLFGPPNPHDREDLVSYAKRVLRLVKRSSALEASTRRVKELEEALEAGDYLIAGLRSVQRRQVVRDMDERQAHWDKLRTTLSQEGL